MKLECCPDSFQTDPEGIAIAAEINKYLPTTIRIFSVQRVSKKFDARRECIRRTYHFYLPAALLGLKGDGGVEDTQKLQTLKAAWKTFEGNKAFHNYTKRRLYRYKQKGNKRVTGHRDTPMSEDQESDAEEEEGTATDASGVDTGSLCDAQESLEIIEGQEETMFKLHLIWKSEREDNDPIVRRHYRFLPYCSIEQIPGVTPHASIASAISGGTTPCVRLTVTGASFMLHQIRHMVGASVAVALGILPLELLEASLAAPARVNVPLAPPTTLVLAGAEFAPFRRSWDGQPAAASQWTGEKLALKGQGQLEQKQFADEVLMPEVDALLNGHEWIAWEAQLRRVWYDSQEMEDYLATWRTWKEEKKAKKEAKLLANGERCAHSNAR